MNEEIRKLHEELNKTHESLKEYADKLSGASESRSVELQESLGKIIAKQEVLEKRYDEAVARIQRPAYDDAGHEVSEESEMHKRAYEKLLRYGSSGRGDAALTADEVRALSAQSDASGEFLAPTDFESGIIMDAFNMAALRPVVNVKRTGRDSVFKPALSKPVVGWGTEGVDVSEQDLTAGGERIEINEMTALWLMSNNTLEDIEADVQGELQTAFGEATAESEDDAIAVGANPNRPEGIFSSAAVQANFTVTGVAAAVTDSTHNGIDVLIAAQAKLKSKYDRNATWAMNSITASKYRTVKDVDANYGQYIWQPPVQAGDPVTLLGKPVIRPEGAPTIGAGTFPVVYGDFRAGYTLYDRRGMTIQRLNEKYSTKRQTGFLLTKRVGGQVVQPEAFQSIKVSA